MIDNRKTKIKDFYKKVPFEIDCDFCTDANANFILKDGFDSRICESCLNGTLEEHSLSDDFESNQFKKEA